MAKKRQVIIIIAFIYQEWRSGNGIRCFGNFLGAKNFLKKAYFCPKITDNK